MIHLDNRYNPNIIWEAYIMYKTSVIYYDLSRQSILFKYNLKSNNMYKSPAAYYDSSR